MLNYYASKLLARAASRAESLRWKMHREPGVVHGAFGEFRFSGPIVFAFWNPTLLHLGDQLFHQPLMQVLSSRCEVRVAGPGGLQDYFQALGFKTLSVGELQDQRLRGAVLIAKSDQLHEVRRTAGQGNYFIGLDYPRMQDGGRVTSALARTVLRILHAQGILDARTSANLGALPFPSPPTTLLRPPDAAWIAPLRALPPRKLLVFNDFVASDHVRARSRRHLLAEVARRKRSEGHLLAYVGSEADRIAEPRVPDFIDHDLRGQLRVTDLYALFALDAVAGLISFDTFIAHVASQVGKDLHIVVKNLGKRDDYRARYVPMHEGAEHLLKHLA